MNSQQVLTRDPALKAWFDRLNQWEGPITLLWNRRAKRRAIQRFFITISRLGDGVFWYTLMALCALLLGPEGRLAAAHMMTVGLISLGVYKLLKGNTLRDRPCDFHAAIVPHTPPLDQYSFPSGHTMHAVGFSVVACAYFPTLAWFLVPFTLLVAMSRMVLGLHYPSDVLIGAGIGATIAALSLQLMP